MKSKVLAAAGFLALFLAFFAGRALADPPKNILLGFNPATHLLQVNVLHPTRNLKMHFINKVIVTVNGKEVFNQLFPGQTNRGGLKAEYNLPNVVSGSKIEVTASCNRYGSLVRGMVAGRAK